MYCYPTAVRYARAELSDLKRDIDDIDSWHELTDTHTDGWTDGRNDVSVKIDGNREGHLPVGCCCRCIV